VRNLNNCYLSDEIKEDEMDMGCDTLGGEEDFGGGNLDER
jgi:hypothetical protein